MRPIDTQTELQLVPVEEAFDIPLDISDIISICREYSKLGFQMQQQVELIMDLGISDAINSKAVSASALPHLKHWLQQVIRNPLFGDAGDQAAETVRAIEDYQELHPTTITN
jgi:hypothetical protein